MFYNSRRLVLGLFACSFLSTAGAFTFTDDFSGTGPNAVWWTASASGGNTIVQTGGRIEVTQSQISGASGLGFNFPVNGDFEAQVDYALIDWPLGNYERIGLGGSVFGVVERSQHPGWFDEAYLTHFSVLGDGVYPTPTTDLQGTLRLVRSGSTVTGQYLKDGGWVDIHSLTNPAVAADTLVGFSVWNGYASVPVRVAFDNFRLDAPAMANPVPEPQTLVLLLIGLGIVGTVARRRGVGSAAPPESAC
jgi:hypothetical protein